MNTYQNKCSGNNVRITTQYLTVRCVASYQTVMCHFSQFHISFALGLSTASVSGKMKVSINNSLSILRCNIESLEIIWCNPCILCMKKLSHEDSKWPHCHDFLMAQSGPLPPSALFSSKPPWIFCLQKHVEKYISSVCFLLFHWENISMERVIESACLWW